MWMKQKDEPIRVAQIMGKLWAGGVEMVVFNYYRAIDKSKIQFDFYYDADSTVEPPQNLIDMGARFYKIPPYQKLPQYIRELKKHLKENQYLIVHSHLNTLSVFPLFVAWMCRVPVRVAHNHSVPSGKELKRDALKYFLRIFGRVFPTDYFACSEKAGRWMFGNRNYDAGKVVVIKNATDFERFRVGEEIIEKLKKQLGLNDKFVIGHIGRFTFAKNHEFLLDVFKKISDVRNDAVLLLVGDGELNQTIHNSVKTKVININLNGIFLTDIAAGKYMLENGGGSIINTASMSAHIVNVPQPQCAYNASKAGVIQLTKSLAIEWAKRGVRVNCISPGYIGTELTLNSPTLIEKWNEMAPMGRMGKPEELEAICVYLAGDIEICFIWIPIVLCVLIAVLTYFYKLDSIRGEMTEELEKRR